MDAQVSLCISSGTVTGLDSAIATSPDLPDARFRRETREEKRAKAKGITHEVQTGDATFDIRVFVASDHADDDLMAILGHRAVRAAILELLDHTSTVLLTISARA